MKFIQQYKNLSKEIYILFFGRVVTSMGSLIWPLLTLILKNKLGYNATTIATITMAMSILQFPMLLLGGKLADTMNRKKIIVCCDMVTVISYIICGLLPLSGYSIALFYLAGVFADYTPFPCSRCHSDLQPAHHRMDLQLSQTLRQDKKVSEYEEKRENEHVFKILWERRPILIYALVAGFGGLVYAQFNYLLPLNMETLYGAKGAAIFGMLTSTNALVVIIATPIITTFAGRIIDVQKILIGESLIILGLSGYRFVQGIMPLYFVLMIIFPIRILPQAENAPLTV